MNQAELQRFRNQNMRKIKHEDSQHYNKLNIHAQNTFQHEKKKFEICYQLREQGKHFITEARFKNKDIRADIYVLDDDKIIEIESSSYEMSERKKDYPENTEIILLEED